MFVLKKLEKYDNNLQEHIFFYIPENPDRIGRMRRVVGESFHHLVPHTGNKGHSDSSHQIFLRFFSYKKYDLTEHNFHHLVNVWGEELRNLGLGYLVEVAGMASQGRVGLIGLLDSRSIS